MDEDTLYVDAAAAPGGDGSAGRPFSTIQAGADAAGARGGRLVAIASGTYRESLALGSRHDGVTLAGRCAEQVAIDGSAGEGVVVRIERDGRDARPAVALAGLTITGGREGGVYAANANLEANRLEILDNAGPGIATDQVLLTLSDTTVARAHDTRGGASGVIVVGGSDVTIRGVRVDDTDDGIYVANVGELTLQDLTVSNTVVGPCLILQGVRDADGRGLSLSECAGAGVLANTDSVGVLREVDIRGSVALNARSGYGVAVASGARLAVEDVSVTDSGTLGAYVVDGGSSLELTRGVLAASQLSGVYVDLRNRSANDPVPTVLLTDVQVVDSGDVGIAVMRGARLEADRIEVIGNTAYGVYGENVDTPGETSELVLRSARIAGTHGGPTSLRAGLYGEGAVRIVAQDSVVEDNEVLGVLARSGADVTLEGCTVTGTGPNDEQRYGIGVQATTGSRLRMQDCVVADNREVGISMHDAGTHAEIVDTVVRDTLASLDPATAASAGGAIVLGSGATATAERVTIENNSTHGVNVDDAGSVFDITDSTIRGTYQSWRGMYGRGAAAQDGGTLRLLRTTIDENVEIGVIAHGANSVVELTDSVVSGTKRGRTGRIAIGVGTSERGVVRAHGIEVRDTQGPGGYAHFSGTIELTDSIFHGNAFAGLAVLGNGILDVRGGAIHDNAPDPYFGGGLGIAARSGSGTPSVRIDGTDVRPHAYSALWFDGPGTYTVIGAPIAGGTGVSRGPHTLHGNAIVAMNGVVAADGPDLAGLYVESCTLYDAVGPAILLDGSGMTQRDNAWSGNAIDLLQQRCASITPLSPSDVADLPRASLCPEGAILTETSLVVPLFVPGDVGVVE